MNRKTVVLAFLLILSIVILIQPASVSAKPTSVTFQTSAIAIEDVVSTNLGKIILINYQYSTTSTGIFAGTCTWEGTGIVTPEKSIKDKGYFTITTSVGSITLKTSWNAVWEDGSGYITKKATWTIVSGTGDYASIGGRGTFDRDLAGMLFEGVIR